MDLKSGHPYWPIADGLLANYPALDRDERCEVAIVGGGITGALCAYHLAKAGIDAVVVDDRDIGQGSTSASTGLLQYEVDTPLFELIDKVGRDHAERSYRLCLEAVHKIGALTRELGDDCGFRPKRSLYVASHQDDVRGLASEYEARRACGIKLDFLSEAEIGERFSFRFPAALLSYDAAMVDAFRLTHFLIGAAARLGVRVYDRTKVVEFDTRDDGVTLRTNRGPHIDARWLVMAGGYESQNHLKEKVTTFRSTYAAVSEPRRPVDGWNEDQCLIWETARPYLYLRPAEDGRVLLGGEDDRYDIEAKRDLRIARKTEKLVARFEKLFPGETLDIAYAWAGAFGETKDGLAYIGPSPEMPSTLFTLGFGGNGITYSVIAAEIVCDLVQGRMNRDAEIFRFGR